MKLETPSRPARPLRADAQRNRALLMATARELFSEGQSELRMDEVARRAGVGIGTLYRHFETRDALIEAVYRQEIETLCASAGELLRQMPADAALSAFLSHLIDYAADNRGLATALITGLNHLDPAEALTGHQRLMEAVSLLLRTAVAQGSMRADVEPATVLIVIGSLCSTQQHPGWKRQAQSVVSLLLDGLRFGV
jgi:AcrR family transcriptional regulator